MANLAGDVRSTLADLSWPEVSRTATGRMSLIVPIGSTEQHGPHLPLSTDTDIALALAEELAACCPGMLVAPAVAYGSSGEHAAFAGTISIGRDAVYNLLVELVRSATDTFPRVLLISAHGGNGDSVRAAEKCLQAEDRNVRTYFPRWKGDAHAGRVETSLMLALRPERVNIDLAETGERSPVAALMPRLLRGGVASVSANGILGDPAGACAEEGRILLAGALSEMVDLVAAWTGRP